MGEADSESLPGTVLARHRWCQTPGWEPWLPVWHDAMPGRFSVKFTRVLPPGTRFYARDAAGGAATVTSCTVSGFAHQGWRLTCSMGGRSRSGSVTKIPKIESAATRPASQWSIPVAGTRQHSTTKALCRSPFGTWGSLGSPWVERKSNQAGSSKTLHP